MIFLTQQPFSEKIYYLNPINGTVFGSIDPVANDTIGSLEWDGVNIRVANVTTGSGSINTINPTTGAQIGTIPAPVGRGEGLGYDGVRLYYSTINRIYVMNPATGAVLSSFIPPGGDCRSLAYGNGFLFSGNSAGKITVFDRTTLASAAPSRLRRRDREGRGSGVRPPQPTNCTSPIRARIKSMSAT